MGCLEAAAPLGHSVIALLLVTALFPALVRCGFTAGTVLLLLGLDQVLGLLQLFQLSGREMRKVRMKRKALIFTSALFFGGWGG